MRDRPSLAIIGGSGIYTMPGLTNTTEHEIETPFGKTSAPIVIGNNRRETNCIFSTAWNWTPSCT